MQDKDFFETPENIISTIYSNAYVVSVSDNDILIDFLSVPPVLRGDKMVIDGTRVYMTHQRARDLAEMIWDGLDHRDIDKKSEDKTNLLE